MGFILWNGFGYSPFGCPMLHLKNKFNLHFFLANHYYNLCYNAVTGLRSLIVKDDLIKDFGRHLLMRLGGKELRRPTAFNPLRQKLRSSATILLESRKLVPGITDMSSLLTPIYFKAFITACKTISMRNEQMGLTIGSYVKQLILLKISKSIQTGDENMQKNTENFRYLMDAHFLSEVSSVAGKTQRLKRINKVEELPLSSDLYKLSTYLKEELTKASDPNRISKLACAYLTLYNKRRPMEVSEITTKSFKTEIERPIVDNPEVLASLSLTERLMGSR